MERRTVATSGTDVRLSCSLALLFSLVAAGCTGQGGPGGPPGAGGTGGGGTAGAGGTGGGTGGAPQPPVTPDAAAGPDAALPTDTGQAAPDVARPADAAVQDAAGDRATGPDAPARDAGGGGADAATGADASAGRVSLEADITARWTGDRRTITMEGGTSIFKGAYRAGQFGGSGDGHIVRLRIAPGSEYIFEYRFRFDPGFDFSRGGKIPGLGGGNAPSGCEASTGVGFTARSMWRQQGRLIGYIYDMDQSGECGNAIETGFNFAVGRWYQVRQRIKLNTGSSRNGVLQLWIDDRQVINRSNMGWMAAAPDRRIDRVFLDFFFGGSTADWSPSRACSISFTDVYVTKLAD